MDFSIIDLGLIDYDKALFFQRKSFDEIYNSQGKSALIFCEHNPVITIGRSSKEGSILKPRDEIEKLGIKIYYTDRGGDVTLHLPGQLVIYPIFDLRLVGRDINKFLRILESVAISSLKRWGISAKNRDGFTGVWINDKKIVSIGISVKHWITMHGLSLNIDCDLSLFSLIKPCGQDIIMTSFIKELGPEFNIKKEDVKETITDIFSDFLKN